MGNCTMELLVDEQQPVISGYLQFGLLDSQTLCCFYQEILID